MRLIKPVPVRVKSNALKTHQALRLDAIISVSLMPDFIYLQAAIMEKLSDGRNRYWHQPAGQAETRLKLVKNNPTQCP